MVGPISYSNINDAAVVVGCSTVCTNPDPLKLDVGKAVSKPTRSIQKFLHSSHLS